MKKSITLVLLLLVGGALLSFTQAPDKAAPPQNIPEPKLGRIEASLVGKSLKERALIKSQNVLSSLNGPQVKERHSFSGASYDIEILSTELIDGGVSVLARAWDSKGNQIGFGTDGSVDIERFLVYNPPMLVSDPSGDVQKVVTDPEGNLVVLKYREDPKLALMQTLVHTISVKKERFGSDKIKEGKVGKTTATIFSTPGTATSGYVQRQAAETWATIRSATDGTSYGDDNGGDTFALIQAFNIGGSYRLTRGFILFDTSSLGSGATINSATLSLYGDTISSDIDTDGGSVNIFSSTPASDTALALADYDQIGSTSFSTAINIGSWTRGGYNDFALNASGLADINKTGISKFSIRTSFDSANSAPSGNNVVWMSLGNTSGTTQDPKIVVEYTVPETVKLFRSGGSIIRGTRVEIK